MNKDATYSIYLTTGKDAYSQAYEWGGCHITMAGFDQVNGSPEMVEKIKQISKDSMQSHKGWTPGAYTIKQWKKVWTIVLEPSRTLDKVAAELKKQGFSRIKGPDECGVKFHMTLPHISSRKNAEQFAKQLKKSQWFLTVAQKTSTEEAHSFQWIDYKRLGKITQ